MSETLRKIDELLKVLDRHVADLREEAKEDGFEGISLEWTCLRPAPANVRLFLTTGLRGACDTVQAPTAEDAFAECVRRVNWESAMDKKRTGAP